jgi:hypothetical protein
LISRSITGAAFVCSVVDICWRREEYVTATATVDVAVSISAEAISMREVNSIYLDHYNISLFSAIVTSKS